MTPTEHTDQADRPVTVADIAAEAGVSRATVSKVLNGRADVAPATRAQIEAMLADRGYVPTKRTRRALAAERRGGLIEMVLNDAGTPWAAEMIRGAEAAARAARAGVVVSVLDMGSRQAQDWLEDVAERGSRGVILGLSELTQSDHKRISRLGVPAILVDPVGDVEFDMPSIGAGNWGGGMAATRHLVELGHRRIATITGPMGFLCSQARLAGYRAALDLAGIPADDRLVEHGDFHYSSGLTSTLALLDRDDPPTAIFAANDEQALGVYAAIRQRGLRVPDDVSVVGFDDVPMSQWFSPPLTTVRQPIADLAALAVRTLLAHADGVELPQGRVELSTKLIVRDSTARKD
ncbi:LacI family transcriptional regulator [Planotetraspora thailandica]|uniref:LacI family transcriptional regulator n=1 Tax=Planotetraspora thailandica TaxID=487172 RepID=A0A8J3VFM3_9ACTN|nr:LacI family DNA-binding transcriptional regulator [Planotetraspora thailandica]GII57645.1 LacI family transcriptional regulator [Planotetraspora thailandica]